MQIRTSRQLLLTKTIGWILILISGAGILVYLSTGYEWFVELLKSKGIPKEIPISTYHKLGVALPTVALAGVAFLIYAKRIASALDAFGTCVRELWTEFQAAAGNIPKNDWFAAALLLIISIAVKLYFVCTFPITYDEAWSYINFTSRGLLYSLCYYPAPNNHIVNSALTNLTTTLPVSAELGFRLPAFIAGHMFLVLLFMLLHRRAGSTVAILLTGICIFLPPVFTYSIIGRGYSFVLLFFILAYIATIKIVYRQQDTTRYFVLLSLSSAFGFYTMPSFLYPYVSLNLFIFLWAVYRRQISVILNLIVWGIVTTIVVLVLYTPVFIVSGVDAVVANPYVLPVDRQTVLQNWVSHFASTYEFLFFIKPTVWIVPMVCIAVAIWRKKDRTISILTLWTIGLAFLIPIIHSVVPFLRTWIYLIVPILVSIGLLPLQSDWLSRNRVFTILILLPLMAVAAYESYRVFGVNEAQSVQSRALATYMLEHNVHSVYVAEPLTDAFILFAYKKADKPVRVFIHDKDLEEHRHEIEILILVRSDNNFEGGEPVYSNDYVVAYRNPDYKTLEGRED